MHARAREQTVIVLLEVAGRSFGLPIGVVRDTLTVRWTGRGGRWQARGAPLTHESDGRSIDVGGRRAPLIDLGASLGLSRTGACLSRTRLVVVVQCGERWLGLLVDGLGEIVEVPLAAIDPCPGLAVPHEAIRQVVRLGDRMIGLLDADHLGQSAEQPAGA